MGAFEVVTADYRALHERAVAVLERDPRVLEVRLAGSLADGTADEWSDLDLHVAATADGYESFLGDWPTWMATITPTIFARTVIAPFIINSVTADGLTFDVAVFRGEVPTLPGVSTGGYRVGMLASRPFPTAAEALDYALAEQLRGLAGPFIKFLERGQHVAHFAGVPHVLGLLTTVLLIETETLPSRQVDGVLTDEQRTVIGALPAVSATRDGLMAFELALAELLVTRARPLFSRHGLTWPTPLARHARDRLLDVLGVDASGWLP